MLGHRWGLGWQHTLLDEEGRSSEDVGGRVRAVMEQVRAACGWCMQRLAAWLVGFKERAASHLHVD